MEYGTTLDLTFQKRKWTDRFMCSLLVLAALSAIIPLGSVLGYVMLKGIPGLDLSFFTKLPAPVGETGGGMANALIGTLILVAIGSTIGIGWGLAVGIFLSEYGNGKLGKITRFCADLLSSVPSIVIGLFVYVLFVLPMKRFSAIAGGVALGIIMIPVVARSAEELLRLVPTHIREAGLALGIPRWRVILQIVLRGARTGIATGVILAIARVAGETAPLLFTALNNHFWQRGLDQPIASIPVQIYTYAISPFEDWHQKAWAGALVLVMMVFAVNLVMRLVMKTDGAGRE